MKRYSTAPRQILATLLVISVMVFVGLASAPVEAAKLKAGIFMTQLNIPRDLTEAGLIGFVRGHNSKTVKETTGGDVKARKWIANVVIAFNSPPGDLEYSMVFYDVTDGARRLVQELSTFVNDRKQKTYLQRIVLERPRFQPNRKLEMVIVVHRQEVGRCKFTISGEEPRRKGEVTFTEEEAKP